jgi:uncharacterized LabA/DUF88 family protein
VDRVKTYVDGFNLYHGLKQKHGRRYLWLDLEALTRRLIKPSQRLVAVDYFTARVRNQPTSERRQATYLDALSAHSPLVHVVEGRFQEKTHYCRSCGNQWSSYEEKETDVSIAVTLVEDGAAHLFDTALLISGDSDMCPVVRSLRRVCPGKRVIAVFPPKRNSAELGRLADGVLRISDANIRQSQLPAAVVSPAGISLKRPNYWT